MFNKRFLYFIIIFIIILIFIFFIYFLNSTNLLTLSTSSYIEKNNEKKFIKWIDFNLNLEVMKKTSELDINSHINNSDIKYNWIEFISYLACKYGNDFTKFKQKDLNELVEKLNTTTMSSLTKDLEYYNYYFESYNAILSGFIGYYETQVPDDTENITFETKYGLKSFCPIAKNYNFSHYNDFGASRSYGYKRTHLGNDLMGSIGTPIIAIESGTVEALRLEPIWWLAYWY